MLTNVGGDDLAAVLKIVDNTFSTGGGTTSEEEETGKLGKNTTFNINNNHAVPVHVFVCSLPY